MQIKRTTAAKFCIQNVYKSLSKCGIHLKCGTHVCILYTFCIHEFDLQKVYIIKIMYTVTIQNLYRMYIKIISCKKDPTFQHTLTRLLRTS